MEQPAEQRQINNISIPQAGKLDFVLGRIDLIAFVITLLGICLLGLVALGMAVIEVGRLIAFLWADTVDRWLIITLGVAIVWVIARWKKSCVV